MKLLTKEILKKFENAETDFGKDMDERKVIVKFFGGAVATWLATEYDPETKTFFGYVSLFNDHNNEWGYFTLDELEAIKFPPFGLGVERDMYLGDMTVKEYKEKYGMV